jgi:hypothetical protein
MCAQKALVVDEDLTGIITREVLNLAGYEARREHDRRRAINFLLQTSHPHLVFIRYRPPGWVGFDWSALLTKSRRLQRHAYVDICRCILRHEGAQWEVRERFAIPVLPCPFHADDVFAEAEQACRRLALR